MAFKMKSPLPFKGSAFKDNHTAGGDKKKGDIKKTPSHLMDIQTYEWSTKNPKTLVDHYTSSKDKGGLGLSDSLATERAAAAIRLGIEKRKRLGL